MAWNDFRDQTLDERLNIGFEGLKNRWPSANAVVTDKALSICGHPVMERWEEAYMKDLAEIAAGRGGKVMEVGFGLGISAAFVQQYPIDEHVIIEANHEVCLTAECFAAAAARPTKVIFGFWEDIAPDLAESSFSGILFDTYPLDAGEVHRNHFAFFRQAYRLLRSGGVLTYYSDEPAELSPQHLDCLRAAGFRDISSRLCRIDPPEDCKYWKVKTILSPIIVK